MKFVSVSRKVRSGGEMKEKIEKGGWKREKGRKGRRITGNPIISF